MFIVRLEDGTELIEGYKGINGWNDVPKDKLIASVTLTDCGRIQQTLHGYSHYIVCYKATLTVGNDSSGGKQSMLVRNNGTQAQIMYGIRDLGPEHRLISQRHEHLTRSVSDLFFDAEEKDGPTKLLHTKNIMGLAEHRKVLVKKLQDCQIVEVQLRFKTQFLHKNKFLESEAGYRSGMPAELSSQESIVIDKLLILGGATGNNG